MVFRFIISSSWIINDLYGEDSSFQDGGAYESGKFPYIGAISVARC